MNGDWAGHELGTVDLGDQRLNNRLIKLTHDFSNSPESPINQSSEDWAATKAAYRFFQNESVDYKEIVTSHSKATLGRCIEYPTVLAIQDTTYLTYSHHEKTQGLCTLTTHKSKNTNARDTRGLVMHSTLVVSPEGLALGIIDQKIYSRVEESPEAQKNGKKRIRSTPIEEKDSYRWVQALQNTHAMFTNSATVPITVCDREADIFDFFSCAQEIGAKVLVRASHNRKVNKSTPCSEITGEHLWSYMEQKPISGFIEVTIPKQPKQPERTARCCVRFGDFHLTPGKEHANRNELKPAPLYAVYVIEQSCPPGCDPLDWMLVTNIPVETFSAALEKISWYCLRWRIEIFHKVLKSGLNVEKCRLQTADRLIRYLSVMSIVAWRIFWLTLVSRNSPDASCSIFLKEEEWKILYKLHNKGKPVPDTPPSIHQCLRWIAMLGGFLARKHDGEPGNTHVWRGLKKFSTILEGVALAKDSCG